MIKKIKERWNNSIIRRDFTRLAPLLGVSGVIILTDDARGVVMFALAIVMLAIAIAHITRKLMMPYLELEEFILKAKEDPLAAGVVVAALMYLLSVIIQALILLLK